MITNVRVRMETTSTTRDGCTTTRKINGLLKEPSVGSKEANPDSSRSPSRVENSPVSAIASISVTFCAATRRIVAKRKKKIDAISFIFVRERGPLYRKQVRMNKGKEDINNVKRSCFGLLLRT